MSAPWPLLPAAFAEFVGRDLLKYSPEVIVENGGDIFLKSTKSRLVGVYAGEDSPLTGRVALKIEPLDTPLGVCTSSARSDIRSASAKLMPWLSFLVPPPGRCCRHCHW